MSELIAVVGQTGTGKSTSIETLDPKETVVINIVGKPLPFKGWKKNYIPMTKQGGNFYVSTDSSKIVEVLNIISKDRPEIKIVVIDDFQYLMSAEFMNRSAEQGWQKFTDIGRHAWDVLNTGKSLREDLKVFVLSHDETITESYPPRRKIKTIGKMLDEKVTLEGLFTIVLFTDVNKDQESGLLKYRFITQNDGTTTSKSPKDMFADLLIPNDLSLVVKGIDAYYEGD
jgi:hypothetical protein